jgi:hypothetical protein
LYTLCVLGAPYAVFLIKLQLLIKKRHPFPERNMLRLVKFLFSLLKTEILTNN